MTLKALSFGLLVSICIIAGVSPVYAQEQATEIPFNESIAGDRNLGQYYSWTVLNASGRAPAVYHYTVYDYRILGDNFTYYSINWGAWDNHAIETPGKKYLVVWLRGWIEGTSWYGWDSVRFPVWVWDNRTIYADPVFLQDLSVRYGSEKKIPAVIAETENRTATIERGLLTSERYGWKDTIEYNRMEPGYSNRFEGYLLYQIPEAAQAEDIRVVGWFWSNDHPVWHLTKTEFDQDSIERRLREESTVINAQRSTGIRVSDRNMGRVKG